MRHLQLGGVQPKRLDADVPRWEHLGWGSSASISVGKRQLAQRVLHMVKQDMEDQGGRSDQVQLPADRRHRVRQLLRVAYIGGEIPGQTASDDTSSAVKHNML